ncbi:MAG: sodium:solute symporter [Phycisphaerales bacterium]|nr:sodium:solute symporter [Phycisphaerales bacterium]
MSGCERRPVLQLLNGVDWTIIVVYLAVLLVMGAVLSRRASASLDDYFLGGRKLPWWLLGMSGMASMLDMAGTMLIVSFLYMLGPRGFFIEFRGGAVLILAAILLWAGKWNRRSGCMTGAEWMIFRFGEGVAGHFARIVTAIAVAVGLVGALAYLTKGAGLFLALFLPFSPQVCAMLLIGVATIYTLASGFYGVVYTDFVQSFVILIAVVSISVMAFVAVGGYDGTLDELAHSVTGVQNWTSATPGVYVPMPPGYGDYSPLLLFALIYLLKNVVQGAGMGQDPRYFGARDERSCGTQTFFGLTLMMFRWPMMMGFAVLGLFLVHDRFPERSVVAEVAGTIRAHPEFVARHGQSGGTPGEEAAARSRWEDALARIVHHPEQYPELTTYLAGDTALGTEWAAKLSLLSYHGTINPERILPAVILFDIPIGLRGLLLVALLAAVMSTFDTSVNSAAAYVTRDLYQRYWRPGARQWELLSVTYTYILIVVVLGFVLGYGTTSINDIWVWITMGLGAGLLVPSLLKYYWWRFNAEGVVLGTLFGMGGALADKISRDFFPANGLHTWVEAIFRLQIPSAWPALFDPLRWLNTAFLADVPGELVGFVYLTTVGTVGALLGTFLWPPTPRVELERFYRMTRPFGWWRPLRQSLSAEARAAMTQEHRNDLLALPFVVTFHITLFLLPMLAIIHSWSMFRGTLVVFAAAGLGVYWFWYRNLPPASAGVLDDPDKLVALARRQKQR